MYIHNVGVCTLNKWVCVLNFIENVCMYVGNAQLFNIQQLYN